LFEQLQNHFKFCFKLDKQLQVSAPPVHSTSMWSLQRGQQEVEEWYTISSGQSSMLGQAGCKHCRCGDSPSTPNTHVQTSQKLVLFCLKLSPTFIVPTGPIQSADCELKTGNNITCKTHW